MNKALSMSLVLAVALSLAGCGTQARSDNYSESPVGQSTPTGTAQQVSPARTVTLQAFKKHSPRNDLDVLYGEADAVVKGTVTKVEYRIVNTLPNTVLTIRVRKSWTPGISKGDSVVIARDGGVWSEADAMRSSGRPLDTAPTADQESKKVEVLIDGQPLPRLGDEALYVLRIGDSKLSELLQVPQVYVHSPDEGEFQLTNGRAKRFKSRDFKGGELDDLDSADLERRLDKIAAKGK